MKEKVTKLINVVKKDGLIKGISKMVRYYSANYLSKINIFASLDIKRNREKYSQELEQILKSKYDRIILWRSNFGWNVPLYQRPQHMAVSMAKKNTLVLYEVTTFTDKVKTIKKTDKNLYLINFNNKEYAKLVFAKLSKVKKPKYVQVYSTEWLMGVSDLKEYINNGYKIIYEYIDELTADIAGTKEIPQNIMDKFNYAIQNKEDVYIVATADKLYNDITQKRGQTKLIFSTNGVDYDFYQKFSNFELEKSYLDIINNGKINIGYYGALAKWFDYDLIKKISKTNKYNIILFGVKYDEAFDLSKIEKEENVYYMGVKEYKYLKYYARKIDILTIPFLVNDITKSTSPLKLFEYMALHKPIVTTNMNECQKYKSVLTAKNHQEFIKKLEIAYENKDDKKYLNLLDKEARENSWNQKAEALISYLQEEEKELL